MGKYQLAETVVLRVPDQLPSSHLQGPGTTSLVIGVATHIWQNLTNSLLALTLSVYLDLLTGGMMEDESALEAARHSMRWWNRYYHFLLYVHFSLGIMGILVGALIAADFESDLLVLNPQFLGVLSTLIVGVVSFVQPGRMASVFYDAYWRMRVAILRYSEGQSDAATLVDAIANGFTAVAEIQPESLGALEASGLDTSEDDLTDQQKARLAEFREALLKEKAEEDEEQKVDPV